MKKYKSIIIIITSWMLLISTPAYASGVDIDTVFQNLGYDYIVESSQSLDDEVDMMSSIETAVMLYGVKSSELEMVSDKLDITGVPADKAKIFNFAIDKGILLGIDILDENGSLKKKIDAVDYMAMILNSVLKDELVRTEDEILSKCLNLHIYQIEQTVELTDDVFSIREMRWLTYNALLSTSGLEKIPYWKRLYIDGSLSYEDAKNLFDEQLQSMDNQSSTSMTIGSHEWDFIDLSMDSSKLSIRGTLNNSSYPRILIMLDNNGLEYKKQSLPKYEGSRFYQVYDLSKLKGPVDLSVYCGAEKYGSYYSWVNDIQFIRNDEGFEIYNSPVFYENNKRYLLTKSELQKEEYLGSNEDINLSSEELMKLSSEISLGKKTKMDELKSVYDWVTNNIYYDMDQLKSGEHEQIDSSYVLKEKRTTCGGYANLTAALLRTRGIPAVIVYGYSLDYSEDKDWNENNKSTEEPNHAWVEAFVDGRWIMLDPTWDSRNTFEKGKYSKSDKPGYSYFDPSMEFFSLSHKIIYYKDSVK